MPNDRLNLLSDRERECLRLVSKGRSAKEIAKALGITPNTVKVHLRNGSGKLGVGPPRLAARELEDTLEELSLPTPKGISAPETLVGADELRPLSYPKRMEHGPWFTVPILRFGRQFAALSPRAKVKMIPIITGIILIVGALIANLYGVLELLRRIRS